MMAVIQAIPAVWDPAVVLAMALATMKMFGMGANMIKNGRNGGSPRCSHNEDGKLCREHGERIKGVEVGTEGLKEGQKALFGKMDEVGKQVAVLIDRHEIGG